MPKRETKPKPAGPPELPPERIEAILRLLDLHYPDARCSLDFASPLQLLVATILSAQCTDERVNQVTRTLFEKYPDAKAFAEASPDALETDIRSTGFFRNKARNIRECCQILLARFQAVVPDDMESLVGLPGIGRKTANVILGNAFNIPGIPVDTHVSRVAQRIGLTVHSDPVKIEYDLMAIIAQERWVLFSHQMIQHGRQICQARKPQCLQCPLRPYCDYGMAH